jgi:putative membrane protein
MALPEDPRVYFAAERTLLAWIRTGLSAMGLGVVVAKFGVFLRYIAQDDPVLVTRVGRSELVGLALVLLGTSTCVAAAIQFRRFARTLAAAELPQRYTTGVADVMGWAFAIIGLVLGIYLML